jgi:hypothetical protein
VFKELTAPNGMGVTLWVWVTAPQRIPGSRNQKSKGPEEGTGSDKSKK